MSDRSSKPSFAVSRNLKNAKYHFVKAKIDKLTESSDTTPNSVSTSTWLCVISNMKSTSHKTWQMSLLFLELLQIQNLKRKIGGHGILYPPCPPPNCAHAPAAPIGARKIFSWLATETFKFERYSYFRCAAHHYSLFIGQTLHLIKWQAHSHGEYSGAVPHKTFLCPSKFCCAWKILF